MTSNQTDPGWRIGGRRLLGVLLVGCISLVAAVELWAQDPIRVASYNIRLLDESVTTQQDRLDKLHQVVALLDADVIGLQEIANRAALELVFPPSEWILIIDDDSESSFLDIDQALAVRRPFEVLGFDADLDADDQHFLFPASSLNTFFPGRRDVLFAEIAPPDGDQTFFVLVHHAKSRRGGRDDNDFQREGAASRLIDTLRVRFDDVPFILVGDFNDNPDDRSLNILETGDPNAAGGPEEVDGPFLINLMESLVAADHVSFGRKSNDRVGDRLNTIDPGSRDRNNDTRGTDNPSGDILFDQILIPTSMQDAYVSGSAQVFDFAVGAVGNNTSRASDHLPVFAEFVIPTPDPDPPPTAGPRIFSLLPNPDGNDAGREEITISNFTNAVVDLTGWTLRDEADNTFLLSGTIPPSARLTIIMTTNTMPLNNGGDTITLFDQNGDEVHRVTYANNQVVSGELIVFLPN